jgi:hypothetical protein
MAKYHLYHYFVPVHDRQSLVMTFGHLHSSWPAPRALTQRMSPFVRRKIKSTIDEDAWLLRNMADYDTSLQGMRLGRFDRVLGLTRERMAKCYAETG